MAMRQVHSGEWLVKQGNTEVSAQSALSHSTYRLSGKAHVWEEVVARMLLMCRSMLKSKPALDFNLLPTLSS
jgi:hypothetical protein